MKWEFIAQREMDFLKNCLVYESFVENFKKVIGIDHPDFLTVREGMSYTHYLNRESHAKLAKHLLKKLQKDPMYFREMFEAGKEKFDDQTIQIYSGLIVFFCLFLIFQFWFKTKCLLGC